MPTDGSAIFSFWEIWDSEAKLGPFWYFGSFWESQIGTKSRIQDLITVSAYLHGGQAMNFARFGAMLISLNISYQ